MNKLGTIKTMQTTMKKSGFFGLYKGYSALLFFSVPKNSVRFGTFNYLKTHYFLEQSKLNNFLCGLIAGFTESTLVVTP